jgi:putative endonuclease
MLDAFFFLERRGMYYVYILYSAKLDRFYTGMSKFSAKRLRQHNHGQTRWTSQANDWQEVWRKEVSDPGEARRLEKQIKTRSARRFLMAQGVGDNPCRGCCGPSGMRIQ